MSGFLYSGDGQLEINQRWQTVPTEGQTTSKKVDHDPSKEITEIVNSSCNKYKDKRMIDEYGNTIP